MSNIEKEVGTNPVWGVVLTGLLFLGGGAAIIVSLFKFGGDGAKVFSLLLFFVWCFAWIPFLGMLLASMLNLGIYNKARNAIRTGNFSPTWIARNTTCTGIIMVDEKNRRLYANGDIFSFDNVRKTGLEMIGNKNFLEIVVNTGDNPIRRISMDNANDARQHYERLNNSLGFS